MARAEKSGAGHGAASAATSTKAVQQERRLAEARQLLCTHRRRLLIGLALMLVLRLAGVVLPRSRRW